MLSKRAFNTRNENKCGLRWGHRQVASEDLKKSVNMLDEKGFWEGAMIPKLYSHVRSLASFQL